VSTVYTSGAVRTGGGAASAGLHCATPLRMDDTKRQGTACRVYVMMMMMMLGSGWPCMHAYTVVSPVRQPAACMHRP